MTFSGNDKQDRRVLRGPYLSYFTFIFSHFYLFTFLFFQCPVEPTQFAIFFSDKPSKNIFAPCVHENLQISVSPNL